MDHFSRIRTWPIRVTVLRGGGRGRLGTGGVLSRAWESLDAPPPPPPPALWSTFPLARCKRVLRLRELLNDWRVRKPIFTLIIYIGRRLKEHLKVPLCQSSLMVVFISLGTIHCKKRLAIFPSLAGMSLIKLSLAGNSSTYVVKIPKHISASLQKKTADGFCGILCAFLLQFSCNKWSCKLYLKGKV